MKKLSIFCCFLLLAVSLSGCSLFFAGFPLSGKEELVFSCDDSIQNVQEQKSEATTEAVAASEELKEDISFDVVESSSQEESVLESGAEQNQVEQNTLADTQGLVNLNTATLEELMTLKGIGETRAKAILEYRNTYGSFTKKEDIMQVPGIKEGIYEKLQDQIAVR